MLDIHELRKKPHLSVSAISDYIDCGLLYKFSRIDKIEPEFKSDAQVYGSAVHKVLADLNQAAIIGDQLTIDDFLGRFETYWDREVDKAKKVQYSKGKDFDSILNEGIELFTVFHNKIPEKAFNILAVEEPFQFNINGVDVPLIGVMDLVEEDESGMLIISDYKTSSKAYSTAQVEKNFQMTVYQMAAQANGYADREILLRLDCLIKTKIPKFEQYYTSRTHEDLKRAEKKIIKVWEGIQKGVFIPNDLHWKCNNCQYKTHCNHWFEN